MSETPTGYQPFKQAVTTEHAGRKYAFTTDGQNLRLDEYVEGHSPEKAENIASTPQGRIGYKGEMLTWARNQVGDNSLVGFPDAAPNQSPQPRTMLDEQEVSTNWLETAA